MIYILHRNKVNVMPTLFITSPMCRVNEVCIRFFKISTFLISCQTPICYKRLRTVDLPLWLWLEEMTGSLEIGRSRKQTDKPCLGTVTVFSACIHSLLKFLPLYAFLDQLLKLWLVDFIILASIVVVHASTVGHFDKVDVDYHIVQAKSTDHRYIDFSFHH